MIDYNLIDIDRIFIQTNQQVSEYLINAGLPLTFDFSKKDDKTLYTHFFLSGICEFIKQGKCNNSIFFSNQLTKDAFRNALITKIKKIFGFKIWESITEFAEFERLLEGGYTIKDQFEVYANSETKPKTFKHIKRYLVKDGFTALSDTYFQELSNKMIVCG